MRTTVDIPEPIYRKLKSKAANEGCSVRSLILRVVEKDLEPRKGRISMPFIPSKQPGALTNEKIDEVLASIT